jgi:outer membrane lipopolysaccharide assembly protein LptE/RlpB
MVLIFFSGCNFTQVVINTNTKQNYTISFDESVPILLNEKIKSAFNFNTVDKNNANAKIYTKNYTLNEYSIYAGSALRSLEGEITAKVQLEIKTSEKTYNKNIKIVKRYKSNELNPFAEKEMKKTIEENIYQEILDQIFREVILFEM